MISNQSAGLITGGLGLPADCNMITMKFSLFCSGSVVVVPPPGPILSGTSKVFAPGEIKNMYKPVEYLIPRDMPSVEKAHQVIIKMAFGEKQIEKEYLVSERRANMVIKTINIVNTTKKKISVMVNSVKSVVSKAVLKVKNLRKRP